MDMYDLGFITGLELCLNAIKNRTKKQFLEEITNLLEKRKELERERDLQRENEDK